MDVGDRPGDRETEDRYTRARAAFAAELLDESRRQCLLILDEDPAHVPTLRLLARVELAFNRNEAALGHLRAALEVAPADVKALRDLGRALAETGDLAAGERMLRRALSREPGSLSVHDVLSRMKRYSAGDPDLEVLERLAATDLGPHERMQLGFIMGKALDDVGDHARSFQFLADANARRRATLDYDVEYDLKLMARIQDVFDEELLAQRAGQGSDTEVPVLIVGMPRSGSTLVEQVLSGHPEITAGGERPDLTQLAASVQLLADEHAPFPGGVAGLSPASLAGLGSGYARRLSLTAQRGSRVTDKSLWNFWYLGMLRLIAPRAHVIHCVRDPLDVCTSCFSLIFANVGYSFDLTELGRFHHGYGRLMEHWRSTLPTGWILDVRYEELVGDLEGVARRMIAHCELPWDDRCLEFQEAPGNVRTASFAQVRAPLTRSSVGRWRRYEPCLGPLIEALNGPDAGA